jgi:hypothetical protein
MARISCVGLLLAGLVSTLSPVNAQTCAGTQDFSGNYVFTAVRLAYVAPPVGTPTTGPVFVPQPTAAPGTTGQYSLTPIGQLVFWSSNASPFSSVGRIYADGAGILFSQKTSDAAFARVGTYTVSTDCVIGMTIGDGFSAAKDLLPDVSYQGVLTDRGGEASVIQTSQGSGVLLSFKRPFLASGCSAATLSGRYGLSGQGVDLGAPSPTGAAATTSPLTFANHFNADGAGVVGSQVNATTPGYTGSYAVASDCTGTLTLISPDKATTSKFAFVLTPIPSAPGQLPRASVSLVLDSRGQFAGFAEAR